MRLTDPPLFTQERRKRYGKTHTQFHFISFILTLCLLLSILPTAASAAASEQSTGSIAEATATVEEPTTTQDELPILQLDADCQILKHVDEEAFAAGKHIARLPEEETLSSYVFLNADGSKTAYFMDQPVKFTDADGSIKEKNLTLTAATEGYTTTQNDIQLTLPTDPTSGIRIVYNNRMITLIPQGGPLTASAQVADNSVTYPDYYGEGMSLRYTPTLSGVKEDILLDAYTGVNSFTFRLNTGGLTLYQSGNRYFLAESKTSTERIELGDVVVYDANSKFTIGTMNVRTVMPGQVYMLTLIVDASFLADEATAYPVTIDPTLQIDQTNGEGYIIDAPIFQGYPNYSYGTFIYNRVGNAGGNFGLGRTVVKLPVLTSSSIYTSLDAADITNVTFYTKEATGTSGISVNVYPLTSNSTWTGSNVTWNNVGSWASSPTATGTLTDSQWTGFNITSMVKQWKNGTYNPNCGFIMIGASTTLDKSFCASEHTTTSYRPYVVMTYTSSLTLSQTIADVDKGSTLTLTATTSPAGEAVSWSSSNPSVAIVNSTGKVTGVQLGSATITARKIDGTSASCLVYVTVADGVYYIRNTSAGLYLGTYGSIAENTPAKMRSYSDSGFDKLCQLWKTTHLGNGYYSIRPMHKLDMGLHANGTSGSTVDIVSIGIGTTPSDVPSLCRWGISPTADGSGYFINHVGAGSLAMTMDGDYPSVGMGVITDTSSDTQGFFKWSLIEVQDIPSGAKLYDTSTGLPVTSPQNIRVGETKSLSDLNLLPIGYSGGTNSTNFKWESADNAVTVNRDTGAITGVSVGTATITGSFYENGSYHYVRYTIDISRLLIYQTKDTYYFDEDGNYAADLVCGDMSEDDLRALDWVSWADFEGYSPALHRTQWEIMCATYFAQGELLTVTLDMIDHFMEGSGSPYSNSVLTQNAYEHDLTQDYINQVTAQLGLLLNAYDGDIEQLTYSAETRGSHPLVQALKACGVEELKYDTLSDITNGLTICVDRVWGNKIEVSDYRINGNNYSCTLHYTLYDHFGLDQPDIEKFGPLAGFRSWYVLQHYSAYNSAYKPFLTLIEFDITISGSI